MTGHTISPIRFDEVADLYDLYVNTDLDISFFLREATGTSGKVLELTCGTGRVSIPLLRAGVDLTCVDYSPGMLSRLRAKCSQQGLRCTIIEADIAGLSLADRFDLIFIPFHSFQEIVDPTRQRQALDRIRDHLAHHGRFICTLQNPPVRLRSIDGTIRPVGIFPVENDQTLQVSSLFTYDASARIVRGFQTYAIADANGVVQDQRRLEINFCLHTYSEFLALAENAGLKVEALYGDYNCGLFDESSSPFMIWTLSGRHSNGLMK
jgi:SAM-dependent methyltransferase